MDHDAITKIVAPNGYGKGVTPNPFVGQQKEWQRRHENAAVRQMLTDKIFSLFEPRFITPPETSELIESIVTCASPTKVLELGTHTGFTSLHILRAIVGKPGAKLVSVDCRPAHDAEFFAKPEIAPYWQHIPDWTPGCLAQLKGQVFDVVFVDSDHSVEHCEKERLALLPITRVGSVFLFHDVPTWQTPDNRVAPPVVGWLDNLVAAGFFKGLIFPTPQQLDCVDVWGENYPLECSPHLGAFIRQK
jgi:predicted O-methyltransferase YrrM